jgi:hypothetical protein
MGKWIHNNLTHTTIYTACLIGRSTTKEASRSFSKYRDEVHWQHHDLGSCERAVRAW